MVAYYWNRCCECGKDVARPRLGRDTEATRCANRPRDLYEVVDNFQLSLSSLALNSTQPTTFITSISSIITLTVLSALCNPF